METTRRDGLKIGYISSSNKKIIDFSKEKWKTYISECLSCGKIMHTTRKEVERSCSCSRNRNGRKLPIGYKGKEREVVGYNDHKTRIYELSCLFCGNISFAPREALDIPCKQCFNYRQERVVPIEKMLYGKWKRSIKSRHSNELSESEYLELAKLDCMYCGDKPSNIYTLPRNYDNYIEYQGIDRIDPNKEYVMDNVVPCCWVCNKMKTDMTIEEFKNKISILFSRMDIWND